MFKGKKDQDKGPEFSTVLLREKFVITDTNRAGLKSSEPVIALSNRIVLPLMMDDGETVEQYVVRAQNMHGCVRMAAQIARAVHDDGPLEKIHALFNWDKLYDSLVKGYEKDHNPDFWVAIYYKGRLLFEGGVGTRHAFLDIVEQCDARNHGPYEQALAIAEDAFRQAGKTVTIQHDSSLALNVHVTAERGRCGVILRNPARTATFSFSLHPYERKDAEAVTISACLSTAATLLEGVQLAFTIGFTRQKLAYDLIAEHSPEGQKAHAAGQRLGRLRHALAQIEEKWQVKYRPERPDFNEIIDEAAQLAAETLDLSGTGDWVV